MQDIANAAGLHRTSVSLALRHHPSIPLATRERVLALVEELGYRPNPLVSALMSQLRSKRQIQDHQTIAFLTTYPADNPWRRYPSLREMFAGALSRANELGFKLEEFDLCEEGMNPQRMKKIFLTRGIRGLLLAPMPEHSFLENFDLSPFAVVSLGLSIQSPPLERIASDHFQCMQLVFNHCTDMGYSRIGLALGKTISARLEGRWLAGLLYNQHRLGMRNQPEPLLVQDSNHWWKGSEIKAWYQREKPDVIVLPLGDNNWRFLRRLPGSPGVVNLTRPSRDHDCAGIFQNTFRLGEIAVERVASRLLHNDIGPLERIQNTMLHGEWMDGPSLLSLVQKRARSATTARKPSQPQPRNQGK
jgi:LacI family transcriptional regulator